MTHIQKIGSPTMKAPRGGTFTDPNTITRQEAFDILLDKGYTPEQILKEAPPRSQRCRRARAVRSSALTHVREVREVQPHRLFPPLNALGVAEESLQVLEIPDHRFTFLSRMRMSYSRRRSMFRSIPSSSIRQMSAPWLANRSKSTSWPAL